MKFEMDRANVGSQWVGRLFLTAGAIFTLFVAIDSLIRDGFGLSFFVFVAIVAIGMCIVVPWSWRRSGTIYVDHNGVRIETKTGNFTYPWQDILDMRPVSLSERSGLSRWPYQILGVDMGKRFALIRLRKWLKKNPMRERWGTSIFGIPIFVKDAAVYPVDLDGFLAAARPYWDINRESQGSRREWEKPAFDVDGEDVT